jgi:hypothetical protein
MSTDEYDLYATLKDENKRGETVFIPFRQIL